MFRHGKAHGAFSARVELDERMPVVKRFNGISTISRIPLLHRPCRYGGVDAAVLFSMTKCRLMNRVLVSEISPTKSGGENEREGVYCGVFVL